MNMRRIKQVMGRGFQKIFLKFKIRHEIFIVLLYKNNR